ncbi:MAG: hypothetical protein JKZ00_05130 [Flavobacteriaceae bacterium]|nr:hypothetical protein [Flavobacteriaceae bacterium]
MKKSIFKIAIIFFLIPLVSFGNDKTTPTKQSKTKTIKKEYSVNSDATVKIKNKYGAIKITTWNKNRVEITVEITVKGNNQDAIEKRLRRIDVEFNATSDMVSARTIIEKSNRSWSFWGRNKNSSFQINYFIKMPVTNNADLDNDYGSIELSELDGSADINCDYGKITIGKLNNSNNTINLDYCSRSTVNYMKSGTIDVDYSKLTVDKTTTVKVNSDYSTLNFGTLTDLTFNSDYGSITVNNADNITGNTDYVTVRLGRVTKNVNLKADYGSIRINEIAKGFESVDIRGKYASIKIGTSTNNTFDFILDLSYAGFRYNKSNVDLRKSIERSSKKHYEGTYGKGNSSSKITIKSSYGSVSLTEL